MDLEPLKLLKYNYIILLEIYRGRTSPTNFFEEPKVLPITGKKLYLPYSYRENVPKNLKKSVSDN